MELFKLLGTIAVNNSEANKSIDETTGKVEKSESKMSAAFKKIGAAVAAAVSVKAISEFGKKCVSMASDVEEMQNKFDVVFQGMTDTVSEWAEDYAKSIGRNSNTIKGYLADNQNMFVGMGMTRDAAAGLSENLVSLALDLASFNNLNETDAVNAMSKALMGETESAKQLGAVLNDNTRAAAMEKLGYEGKYDALSEAEKMEVNYQAILMQSQDAVGDCERSLDSYKGRTLQLNSAKEKLQETIGTMLLPAMTKLAEKMTGFVTKLQSAVDWCEKHKTTIEILAIAVGTLASAILAYNIAMNAAAITTAITTAATTAFGAAVAFLTSPITIVIAVIGALVAAGVLLYKNWDKIKAKAIEIKNKVVASFNNMKSKVVSTFSNMKEKAVEIFSNIKDGITKKVESIKSSVTETFNKVKYAMTHPVETARDAIKKLIDKIKGFFNFEFKIPKIKLPHFSIKPSDWKIGDLLKGSIPSLGIDWYAKAMDNPMLMTKPTAFGINASGQVMAGGEKGSEVVSGAETLMNMISQAVASQNEGLIELVGKILEVIVQYMPQMSNMQLVMDSGALVGELAPAMDKQIGSILKMKERGV